MYRSVLILLACSFVVDSCDFDINYMKDGQCCKMCGPVGDRADEYIPIFTVVSYSPVGAQKKFSRIFSQRLCISCTRMKQNTDCKDPTCENCGYMEYQDGFSKDIKCKLQPRCDENLNFLEQNSNNKEYSPCQCKPGHHCSGVICDTCVKNTECKPGEQVSRNGTQMSDTECEECPEGTFSNSIGAVFCQDWTECISLSESVPGSSTSDRTCRFRTEIIIIVIVMPMVLCLALGILFISYKKVKMGSASFSKKAQECCELFGTSYNQHRVHEQLTTEDEILPNQDHEPEETEEPRPDTPLSPGISENGNPVSQDNSKSLILSESETEPASHLLELCERNTYSV